MSPFPVIFHPHQWVFVLLGVIYQLLEWSQSCSLPSLLLVLEQGSRLHVNRWHPKDPEKRQAWQSQASFSTVGMDVNFLLEDGECRLALGLSGCAGNGRQSTRDPPFRPLQYMAQTFLLFPRNPSGRNWSIQRRECANPWGREGPFSLI